MPLIQGQAVNSSSAGGFYPKTINGSLRFDSLDGAYLQWTPDGAGTSGTTFTISVWFKISDLSPAQDAYLFSAGSPSTSLELFYVLIENATNDLRIQWRDQGSSTTRVLQTSRKFRDPSAWYHLVISVDTNASGASNRMKVYINGELETSFASDSRSTLNSSSSLAATAAVLHTIGAFSGDTSYLWDGYMAEYFLIDGTAHGADAFGEFNNGIWVPKNITASSFTMGNNGFYLNFEDDATVEAFNTVLYEGDGHAANRISGAGFQPDFVWIKSRTGTQNHYLQDSARGAPNYLVSNNQGAQNQYSGTGVSAVTGFDSDGFSLGADAIGMANTNNQDYVAWCWDAGGASQSNTYVVKVVSDSGNKYRFDDFGTSAITLRLSEGGTYRFDQADSSNSGHPIRFSTTSDGTHGGGSEYTTGVTTNGTPGSAGAYTEITVASGAPTLYYYCSNHSGMGGQANTESLKGYTNVDGTTQSTVVASDTTGFSTVIYTGTGANATVGHGLSSAPDWMIIKNRTDASDWAVYHTAVGNTTITTLNGSAAPASANTVYFQNTDPSNSVITLGSSNVMNGSGDDIVAYCWTETTGVSKFGSYSGNGSTTGPTVTCGFKPAWIMIRRTDAGNNWIIHDNTRVTTNPNGQTLLADTTAADTDYGIDIDFNSNGFQIKSAGNAENNASGTYAYMAFADTRSAAFWLDQSSNNNDWQPENLDYMDSLSDSPTENYPTLNPLSVADQTLSNGNLQVIGSTIAWAHSRSTQSPSTGKWYCEVSIIFENAVVTDRIGVGVINVDSTSPANLAPTQYLGQNADSWSYFENGQVWNNAANTGSVTTYDAGDVIGMALDLDSATQTITWYKNGTQIVQKDLADGRWTFGVTTFHIGEGLINFGQQPFIYTPPSGFESINSTNMPDPVVDPSDGEEPQDYFETFTYMGNGTSLQVGDVIKKPADTVSIGKSLIFEDNGSDYLYATAGAADTTYTVSLWFKRADVTSSYMYLWSSANAGIALNNTTNRLYVYNGSGTGTHGRQINDNDWHHVVYSQSSGSYTLYLDGIQIGTGTGFTITTTANHINIGRYENSSTYYFDGYIAEFNFISGTAYAQSDFGNFDANGIWIPKAISVTYGSAGYRLQFADATSATTLGYDTSGNSNHFTLSSNITTADSSSNSPTDTLPIMYLGSSAKTKGALYIDQPAYGSGSSTGGGHATRATQALPLTGKWFWEAQMFNQNQNAGAFGIIGHLSSGNNWKRNTVFYYGNNGYYYEGEGGVNSRDESYGATFTTNDYVGVAYNADVSPPQITFYKNGTSQGTITMSSTPETGRWYPMCQNGSNSAGNDFYFNFGDRTMYGTDGSGTLPTGYQILSENNIPVSTDNLENPDFVWIKDRSYTYSHVLVDSVRGVGQKVYSNVADAEVDDANSVIDFNTNGFTVGNNVGVNARGNDYVSWTWKAGTSFSFSGESGTTDSSGSSNSEAGFSIVSYTGASTERVKHNLSSAPEIIMVKNLSGADSWAVYHKNLSTNNFLELNFDYAQASGSNPRFLSSTYSTSVPTSTYFYVRNYSGSTTNDTGDNYIAYCFHSVDGFSKVGVYSGNNSADGPFVYTGFKPAFVMTKRSNSTGSWLIMDSERSAFNQMSDYLQANENAAEVGSSGTVDIDFLSNGFKPRSNPAGFNGSGDTIIYMAFAEQPFKYANAR